MEFAKQSVSDLFLGNGDIPLDLDPVAPPQMVVDQTVHVEVSDITAQIISLEGQRLDLQVSSQPIIEPISPAEVPLDENAFIMEIHQPTGEQTSGNLKDTQVLSTQNDLALSVTGMPEEILLESSSVLDSSHVEPPSDFIVHPEPSEEPVNPAVQPALDPGGLLIENSKETLCEKYVHETPAPNSTLPVNVGCLKEQRKHIPPKKDRMDPLKLDMSKPSVIPLTSSQISLQCLECHIIFSDHKSKQRHLKMNHPTEYQQCMLGDALFACYVCDRHFNCSTELMAHQRSHTEKQPFKCPICGEAFKRSSELTNHKKIHYGKHGYTCSDCGKLYKTLTLLKYHQRKHTGERPYVCIHKECGKRFSMPKALQKHLETHEKDDAEGAEGAQIGTASTKKKRNKGPSIRKFACSQCEESFKTAKAQLHHIKIKHPQCKLIVSPSSTESSVDVNRSPLVTQTAVAQPPVLRMEPVLPAPQQIGPLGAEQIKRLIEKLGNVQKVNQLIILGVDQGNMGMQQPQGIMQPLQFNFTEPTEQPVQPLILQHSGDETMQELTMSTGAEQSVWKGSIEVAVEQEETTVQGEGTMVSVVNPETQVTTVQSDMAEAQLSEVQFELVPEMTEKAELAPQLEESLEEIHSTEEQNGQNSLGIETLDTENVLSLIPVTNFESTPSQTSEEKYMPMPVDEEGSKNTSPSSDPAEESQGQRSDPPALLEETEPATDQVNIVKFDNPQFEAQFGLQDAKETSFLEKSTTTTSLQPLVVQQPLDSNMQHDQEKAHYDQEPCNELDIQQNTVISVDKDVSSEKNGICVKKKIPLKKKKPKKQVSQRSQTLESCDEVAVSTSDIKQKTKTAKKPLPKRAEKTKGKKLVCFGPKETKEKFSKQKLLQIAKASKHKVSDSSQVGILSQKDIVPKMKQKNQKHKKAVTVENSPRLIKSLNLTPSEQKQMKELVQTPRGKPQKRKLDNPQDLEKKGKSVYEIQEKETHVAKKKKPGKLPEAVSEKKAKVKNASQNQLRKELKKLPKRKENEQKTVSKTSYQDQIKQQALLLLKGHKQPQVKVHKLDAKTTGFDQTPKYKCQTKQIDDQEGTVSQEKVDTHSKALQTDNRKKRKAKPLQKKSKKDQRESAQLRMTPTENSVTSEFSPLKPKVARKRKAPTKIDQEIALSPPFSRLIIGCQDCGRKFSEVSALQEHMASMHSENGTFRSNMTCGVSNNPTMSPRSSEGILTDAVHMSSYEIQVSTDWDVENEMRAIGLGDRDEHRLSFPALNPSPSFPVASTFVEEENREEEEVLQESAHGRVETLGESSQSLTHESFAESVVGSNERNGKNSHKEEKTEEELPSDVKLVMVEDQNQEDGQSSSHQNNVTIQPQTSSDEQEESSHGELSQIPQLNTQTPAIIESQASTHSTDSQQAEIPQNEDMLVQKSENRTKTLAPRGRRGRGGRGRGRRLGKRNAAENKNTEETNQEECQVVYQLYTLKDNCEERNEGRDKQKTATDATVACAQSTSEEPTKDQDIFEVPSVSSSVAEVVKSGLIQKSVDQVKNSSSSGTVLEDFMKPFEMKEGNTIHDKCGGNPQPNLEAISCSSTSTDVKIEAGPSVSAHNDPHASERDLPQGVQMFVVKAEDHNFLNEPHVSQGNYAQTDSSKCLEKRLDHSTDGFPSNTTAVLPSAGKQCIFYPVKEEEGEVLLEPPLSEQGPSVTEMPEERTSGFGSWTASGLQECEEVRVGCTQMEMHHHLYSSSEEADVGSEQLSTQNSAEFLSQYSDTEDLESLPSEPEAESLVMSCYCGIQISGAAQEHPVSSCDQRGSTLNNASLHIQADCQSTARKEYWKPIDYFIQYFNWDTWKEIAECTGQMSKLPVTDKEVGQFVGIHIAMGTLKFPSMKLYWEDLTRVPLIADAMSSSRFTEITHKMRLALSRGQSSQARDKQRCGQRNTSQMCSCHDAQNCTTNSVSQSDPLWRIQMILNRVQKGCKTLKRSGNHAVDQYPLPIQRHPTHSLHHTVMLSVNGLVMDFNLCLNDCNREDVVEKMVSQANGDNQGMVFLCKPELSTPSMLEHLLEAGVRSAGKVGGARGQVGDEFVTSDGKLKLFRCHHGFILSAVTKERSRSTSLVSGFERAIKAANLNRDLRSLYRTPCSSPSPSAWPQSVLWDLIDLALVNSWLQYKQDHNCDPNLLSLMSFRLEVAKALILSNSIDAQDSSSSYPPAPERPGPNSTVGTSDNFETPLPDAATRYDGLGHWPEQLAEGEEAKCRFGGCERTSRVRCLKCCVFLCISRSHNCFLKFHSQASE